jgi:hypothetical protein
MPVETPKSCFIFIFNYSFWGNLAGKEKGWFRCQYRFMVVIFYFFWQKFAILLLKKEKSPSNLWSRELSGKVPKKSPDFKGESYENIKILEDLRRFFYFRLLKSPYFS